MELARHYTFNSSGFVVLVVAKQRNLVSLNCQGKAESHICIISAAIKKLGKAFYPREDNLKYKKKFINNYIT